MSEQKTISRSALHFSAGTLLSRVSGLAREQAAAYFFGTSALIAAFFVAYRFALALRRLLGEGALLVGFVPHFEEARKQSEESAALFFRDTYFGIAALLFFLLCAAEGTLFVLWKCLPMLKPNQEILLLTMFLLPGLFFICLAALSGALLQCEKRFFLAGVAPVLFNVGWIAAVFLLFIFGKEQNMGWLAFGTILSFALQWFILLPQTCSYLRRFFPVRAWLHTHFWTPEIKQMVQKISVTVIGVGAVQINSVLDSLFARFASLEGPAYLNYAVRLYQLPVAIIGVSLFFCSSADALQDISFTRATKRKRAAAV